MSESEVFCTFALADFSVVASLAKFTEVGLALLAEFCELFAGAVVFDFLELGGEGGQRKEGDVNFLHCPFPLDDDVAFLFVVAFCVDADSTFEFRTCFLGCGETNTSAFVTSVFFATDDLVEHLFIGREVESLTTKARSELFQGIWDFDPTMDGFDFDGVCDLFRSQIQFLSFREVEEACWRLCFVFHMFVSVGLFEGD